MEKFIQITDKDFKSGKAARRKIKKIRDLIEQNISYYGHTDPFFIELQKILNDDESRISTHCSGEYLKTKAG